MKSLREIRVDIFRYFADQHELILTDSEIEEVVILSTKDIMDKYEELLHEYYTMLNKIDELTKKLENES